MCTSLLYFDAANRAYLGRTLELSIELPYQLSVFPAELELSSQADGYKPLSWQAKFPFLAVTMPAAIPEPGHVPGPADLKVVEGMNSAGLTFSVQSYAAAGGLDTEGDASSAGLSAADLGAWVLGQFSSVEEVKQALADLVVTVERVPILGGLKMPFHYSVHDAAGKSIVIEFHHGVRTVYDNPVGVMTNAPQFSWHLTNLNNYTFLTNVDHSKATFGSYEAVQSGAGIAKAGLPVTDTSVDRFIRAAFYAQFAEKQTDADKAVQMIAHIMNNFDRPRGVTVDYPDQGSGHLQVQGNEGDKVPTEFTSWTSLSDLDRKRFFLRDSGGMNFAEFDVADLGNSVKTFTSKPMAQLLPRPQNMTAALC
ncbi:linear amide C-N hydrolase [Martelella lutilitoris]|uniref:Linear amide C-N hydrolase n=1 Tax=Martelella lutilitoris TaxID=2583532 RepID=A0A5C4JRK9_9HYPH|nr:linear amide C-N hydrolase [Martelella lutilitoris]TNB48105.1 linear amide C-N hydrolase [Martelella lutilitoris]